MAAFTWPFAARRFLSLLNCESAGQFAERTLVNNMFGLEHP
jgi:hypothetical protein